jgi:hypothetical protein
MSRRLLIPLHASIRLTVYIKSTELIFMKPNFWCFVSFEAFTAVAIKSGVFWDVIPCGSCKNGRFGGT